MNKSVLYRLLLVMTLGAGCAGFGVAGAASPNAATKAKTPKQGPYDGPTSPVFNGTTTAPSTLQAYLWEVPYSACGGSAASKAKVLCFTSGTVDAEGGLVLREVAQWDTVGVAGDGADCTSVNADWEPAVRIPPSGIASIDATYYTDNGVGPLASPIDHVDAAIRVLKSGVIIGVFSEEVYISDALTQGEMQPLCTTGTVTFRLHYGS